MKRCIESLRERRFDIAVVGAGIYGATLAREAARRGYRVALVDKGDFGAGVSANSLRTLHGGLRYLQHFDIRRMRESIFSRRYFLQFAPDLIENVPFVIPLKGWGIKGPLAMRAALLLNDFISWDRDRGVVPEKHIPGGRIIPPAALKKIIPIAGDDGLTGGAVWYESIASNPERLILSLVWDADRHGACCANYLEAVSLQHEGGKLTAVACMDLISNQPVVVRAETVIDTSGQAAGAMGKSMPAYSRSPRAWCRGVNFIVNQPLFGDKAVGLTYRDHVVDRASKIGSGERYLFFVPWNGQTMVGTFYDLAEEVEDGLNLTQAERQGYLRVVNTVLGEERIRAGDITRWHSGWLPLEPNLPPGQIDLGKDHKIRFVEADGGFTGLIELTGVKLTTAPAVAVELLDRLQAWLPPLASTSSTPPSAETPRRQDHESQDSMLYAMREEMACRLEDMVMRRTSLADRGRPDSEEIDKVSRIMAAELAWDGLRRREEVSRLQAHLSRVC